MDKQTIQEKQQLELALLRSKAHQARVASRRAEIRLRSLNSKYRPAEFDASLGLARVTLSSAVDQLVNFFTSKKHHTFSKERALSNRLQIFAADQRELQRRALEDITLVLDNASKPPDVAGALPICSSADLVEQCATSASLGKYYSDAFGLFVLLLGVTGASLQLPLRHRWQYGGARTAIWLPEDYWESRNDYQGNSHALYFPTSSGSSAVEARRKDVLQALAALERSVAVATIPYPAIRPRRSLMASPLEWLADMCSAALQERAMGPDALPRGHDESSFGVDGDESGMTGSPEGGNGCDDGDEDWELMATDAAAGLEADGLTSVPSFNSVVQGLKNIANNYRVRYQ